MTRIKRLSTMLFSALALSALSLVGGVLTDAVPPAQAAGIPHCNGTVSYTYSSSYKITVPVSIANSRASQYCQIGLWAQGPHVAAVQNGVKTCHKKSIGPSGVDGIYGNDTRAGVKKVQADIGASQDGWYGPETHNKGFKFYSSCKTDPVRA
ncbi:MAG: peptidoglycan-binding protein [Bifidobacteriaceae bacterium]|jgi:peptidoglycan hydrolase-like protein with peptidoglycan-binding domain|nr:peptidoglycan-binding protein [Bifidobacteriaceae bacterium]